MSISSDFLLFIVKGAQWHVMSRNSVGPQTSRAMNLANVYRLRPFTLLYLRIIQCNTK